MFDFSPGGIDPTAFFIGQSARWLGVAIFLVAAWHLGRRTQDWRISALAVAALLVPELWTEIGQGIGSAIRQRGDSALSWARLAGWIAAFERLLRLGLLGSILVLGARQVMRRRREHGPLAP